LDPGDALARRLPVNAEKAPEAVEDEGSELMNEDSVLRAEGQVDVEPGKPTTKPKAVPHLTLDERTARGKAARAELPRSIQAEIEFPKRRDPVALLEEQAASRVPELVPIRYGRMLV